MKYFLLLYMALFFSCKKDSKFVKAKIMLSAIDSITTPAQAEKYLQAIDSNYSGFHIRKISETGTYHNTKLDSANTLLAKKLNVSSSIYKADFDNNGLNDMLLIGGWGGSSSAYPDRDLYFFESLAVMNFSDRKPTVQHLTKNHNSIFVPVIKSTGSLPLLVLHHPNKINLEHPEKTVTTQTTLVNVGGYFVEYTQKYSSKITIEKIEFAAGPCFGKCPMFQMIIEKDHYII